jgi:hypothetical protein
MRATRFVASQLPELALNGLAHGADSPTQPVFCIFYDREEDQVQLVVADLGSRYDHADNAEDAIQADLAAHPEGGLITTVEVAASRGIDATLTLAGGNGRVYWRRGAWSSTQAVAIAGFVAALTVQVD